MGTTADHAAAVTTLAVSLDGSLLYFDATSREAIYRRTDDPDNQNFYGSDDTETISADPFCTTRGSANIYPCTADGVTASFSAAPTNTINSNICGHLDRRAGPLQGHWGSSKCCDSGRHRRK